MRVTSSVALMRLPREVQTRSTTSPEGIVMPEHAIVGSTEDSHAVTDGQIVRRAVLSLWAYSVVGGAVAIGLGNLAAASVNTIFPGSWARIGTVGAVVMAGGLNAQRLLRRVEGRLGVMPRRR